MVAANAVLLILPASLLIGVVCLPNAWVNWRVRKFRQIVTWLAGVQTLIAGSCLIALAVGRLPTIEFVASSNRSAEILKLLVLRDSSGWRSSSWN